MQIPIMPFREVYPTSLPPVTYLQMRAVILSIVDPWVLSGDFQFEIQVSSRISAGTFTSILIMYRLCFHF